MKTTDWMKNKNILQRDLIKLFFGSMMFLILIITILIYPIQCMFTNKDQVNKSIKEGFELIFEKDE